MASPYPIRPATEDDLLAVSAVHEHAFHTGPPSGPVRERGSTRRPTVPIRGWPGRR